MQAVQFYLVYTIGQIEILAKSSLWVNENRQWHFILDQIPLTGMLRFNVWSTICSIVSYWKD